MRLPIFLHFQYAIKMRLSFPVVYITSLRLRFGKFLRTHYYYYNIYFLFILLLGIDKRRVHVK